MTALMLTALLIAACGELKGTSYDSSAPSPSLGEAVFPHTAGWDEPDRHGKYVIDNGTKDCANSCHGEDFTGGSARGCKTCHELYPHPAAESWQGLDGHGKFVISAGDPANCTNSCHADGSARPCTKCHTSYPNKHADTNWGNTEHGNFTKQAQGFAECTTMCHRQDIKDASLKQKACTTCHPSYPEPHGQTGWATGDHSEFVTDGGGVANADCTLCHGKNLTTCATSKCHHDGGSADGEWADANEHGAVAYGNISGCTACHGEDLKGNASIIGCDKCHHNNWTDTNDKPWAEGSEHGTYGKTSTTECKLCHEGTKPGGLSGVACSTCHGDIYPHPADWTTGATPKHGLVAKSGFSKCKTCHGSVTSNECKSCHHDNAANWATTSNPAHAALAASDIGACKVCHGTDLSGGESGTSCYDCHDAGGKYPHPTGWKNKFNHGVQYQPGHAKCQTACHGKALNGGLTGIACNKCHTKYPHPGSSTWIESHGGNVLTTSDDFSLTTFTGKCANCHGGTYTHKKDEYPANMAAQQLLELSFVINPANGDPAGYRCYLCHFAYPHVKGISPSDGTTELPWRKAHTKSIMANWGDLDKTCAKNDACHFTKRRSTNPVQKEGGGSVNVTSAYCTSFCHKK